MLDLYRFQDGSASDPESLTDFTTFERSLQPGGSPIADFLGDGEIPFSSGVRNGDGSQPGHWQNKLPPDLIGIMDPGGNPLNTALQISDADRRAIDLIGYTVNFSSVPEPSIGSLVFAALLYLPRMRPRRQPRIRQRT